MGRLLSVNVGLPREISWCGETVRTSVWKNPVQDRHLVRRPNVDGDGQGDLAGHGSEHRAVLVCQIPTSTGNVNGPVRILSSDNSAQILRSRDWPTMSSIVCFLMA
jgi:hypothetical protein